MTIKIATWNVNSVKPRLQQLLEWLKNDAPDIVLLQEIKCVTEAFPTMEIEELGYNIAAHGQKTYNGVAILSKFPLEDITKGLSGDKTDLQARYIEAVVNIPNSSPIRGEAGRGAKLAPTGQEYPHPNPPPQAGEGTKERYVSMRVASVYVPNGQTTDSDKFQYKLSFLNRLHEHLKTLLTYDEMLVVGGDYNIAPDDKDVHDPLLWRGSVLTHDEARRQFRRLTNLGLHDAFRVCQPDAHDYSWWDYRAGGFARDNGLRIDHLLLSAQSVDKLAGCIIEKAMRAVEKASDHTPVVVELKI